jgi:glycosyltransferase involved in cell wall biosynthesis
MSRSPRSRAGDTVDVLIVSLGSTAGLRAADEELRASLERAGALVALVQARAPRAARTLMLTDLLWARAARTAARTQLARAPARAVIYSSTTAALLWPRPGAIRFDAPSAGNRPGRHGLWQRPLERRRLRQASLLLPWSAGGLAELGDRVGAGGRAALAGALGPSDRALVLPVPVEPSGPADRVRDIAAITYAANPTKKGLDRVLEAWRRVRGPDDQLVVAGAEVDCPQDGVRVTGMLARAEYRALLRRSRVFVCAPRREDYGLAQLEALADGCLLVSTPAPGPYAALAIARQLDRRLVSEDLETALRVALSDSSSDYAERATVAMTRFSRAAVDRRVAEQLLPALAATPPLAAPR